MATLLTVAGKNEDVFPLDDKWTREELEQIVGGYVEILQHNKVNYVIGNEYGRINKLKVNALGTMVCGYEVVGPIVIVPKSEVNFSQVNCTGNIVKIHKGNNLRVIESENDPFTYTQIDLDTGATFTQTMAVPR